MSGEMKYEIKGDHFGGYSVLYGTGYPYSEFIRHICFTMRGAKRVIRRHKRRLAAGKIQAPTKHGITYTEEALGKEDVEKRIAQLERELGMRQ